MRWNKRATIDIDSFTKVSFKRHPRRSLSLTCLYYAFWVISRQFPKKHNCWCYQLMPSFWWIHPCPRKILIPHLYTEYLTDQKMYILTIAMPEVTKLSSVATFGEGLDSQKHITIWKRKNGFVRSRDKLKLSALSTSRFTKLGRVVTYRDKLPNRVTWPFDRVINLKSCNKLEKYISKVLFEILGQRLILTKMGIFRKKVLVGLKRQS